MMKFLAVMTFVLFTNPSYSATPLNACSQALIDLVFSGRLPYSAQSAFEKSGMARAKKLIACRADQEVVCLQPQQGDWKVYGRWNTRFHTQIVRSTVELKQERRTYLDTHWLQFASSEQIQRYRLRLDLKTMHIQTRFFDNQEDLFSRDRVIRRQGSCVETDPAQVKADLKKALAKDTIHPDFHEIR